LQITLDLTGYYSVDKKKKTKINKISSFVFQLEKKAIQVWNNIRVNE